MVKSLWRKKVRKWYLRVDLSNLKIKN